MNRKLDDLSSLQSDFIDTLVVQCKTYDQTASILNVDKDKIRELYSSLKDKCIYIAKIRDKWKSKKIGGDFWIFYDWYTNAKRCCNYCGITQDELDELHILGIINNRPTRGKTFEIDRKIGNKEYSELPNLTFACYWCNNAKSDTFTEAEFKIIGKAIAEVWKQRLNK